MNFAESVDLFYSAVGYAEQPANNLMWASWKLAPPWFHYTFKSLLKIHYIKSTVWEVWRLKAGLQCGFCFFGYQESRYTMKHGRERDWVSTIDCINMTGFWGAVLKLGVWWLRPSRSWQPCLHPLLTNPKLDMCVGGAEVAWNTPGCSNWPTVTVPICLFLWARLHLSLNIIWVL